MDHVQMDADNCKEKVELFDRERLDDFPKFDAEGEDKNLFDAVREDNLIIFYGAGISMLAGCSGWVELAENIIHKVPPNLFSQLDKIVLKEIAYSDPRKAISICYHKLKNRKDLLEDSYFATIKDSVSPKDKEKFIDIHKKIFELNAIAYVTTNIDMGIESLTLLELKNKEVIDLTLENDIDPLEKIKNGNIFYLHGSVARIDKIVFTIDSYIKSYWPGKKIPDFLREVFGGKYTVLFIGYGLNEYEILQNIFFAIDQGAEKVELNKHFLLAPIYSRDVTKFNLERDFFKIFSVKAIPYFIDNEGHGRLNYVLNLLIKKTKEIKPDIFTEYQEIDEV